MNERSNICKYLDMPLQHATTRMLTAMRRGITREKTDALIADIRNKVPEIALRTTLITGFPGETQQDFAEMCEWVKTTRFSRLGVFTYSHEENTHAFGLKDDVSAAKKRKRADEIMAIQSEIALEHNAAMVGKTIKVLIDKHEGGVSYGRTQFDSPEVDNEVLIEEPSGSLSPGQFIMAEVIDAGHYDLIAQKI
jgi:ribosomal protein S12 methylthiotransferase